MQSPFSEYVLGWLYIRKNLSYFILAIILLRYLPVR